MHPIRKPRCQNLEDGWRGRQSKIIEVRCEVSTACVDFGDHIICWCWSTVSPESIQPSTRTFWSPLCFLSKTSFMEKLTLFSSRTFNLLTLPKAPKPGPVTMRLLGFIGQQTFLTGTHRESMGASPRER